jgi:hypothetical protein
MNATDDRKHGIGFISYEPFPLRRFVYMIQGKIFMMIRIASVQGKPLFNYAMATS